MRTCSVPSRSTITPRTWKLSYADKRVAAGFWRITPSARVAGVAVSAAAAWPATDMKMATDRALASGDMCFPWNGFRTTRMTRPVKTRACPPAVGTPHVGGCEGQGGVVNCGLPPVVRHATATRSPGHLATGRRTLQRAPLRRGGNLVRAVDPGRAGSADGLRDAVQDLPSGGTDARGHAQCVLGQPARRKRVGGRHPRDRPDAAGSGGTPPRARHGRTDRARASRERRHAARTRAP